VRDITMASAILRPAISIKVAASLASNLLRI
jgi:hypothetical protein